MAKDKKAAQERPTFGKKEARRRPLLGLLFMVLALLAMVALWDYDWRQNPAFQLPVSGQNKVGQAGLYSAYYSLRFLGAAAWLLPITFYWLAAMFFAKGTRLSFGRYIALLSLYVAIPVLLSLWQVHRQATVADWTLDYNFYPNGLGGWVGMRLYEGGLHEVFGTLGTLVMFVSIGLAALYYLFHDNLGRAAEGAFAHIGTIWARNRAQAKVRRAERAKQKAAAKAAEKAAAEKAKAEAAAERERQKQLAREQAKAAKEKPAPPPPPAKANGAKQDDDRAANLLARFNTDESPVTKLNPPDDVFEDKPAKRSNGGDSAFRRPVKKTKDAAADDAQPAAPLPEPPAPKPPAEEPIAPAAVEGLRIIQGEATRKVAVQPERKGSYVFPPMSLLRESEELAENDSAEAHQRTADQLVRTLGEFGVKVTMGEVHTGPVITRYDVYPAAGVRVEKIQNLDKNLALALKALSVRILAPVPGKGCVGVEIPNRHPQNVFIRDILESENWVNSKAEIPIALGKEVSGKPLIADLTKMPHLLIAGSTGSGKTVCINSVVASLLYKLSPEDVRFVMVDPKIVEMQVYNTLPHMLIPVVTDPKKVPGALKYLLNEMERRYRLFAKEGVRNIAGYNAKRSRDKEAEAKAAEMDAALSPEERAAAAEAASLSVPRELDFDDEPPIKLPYIIAIVDELADLMMVAPADIETGIARLAQLARAAGIHLILATQRPSVNVITGVIKANLPSRIAFKVASKVDSRTILDAGGADQLIGRGDMLFLPPGSADLVRSQGAFVADEEINGIVEFVSQENGEPEFDEQFQRSVEEGFEEGGDSADEEDDDGDELIPEALEVIRSSNRASTSMLQRRLRIGYNRAARIMEILEERGYVGPENGSQPREILRDLE